MSVRSLTRADTTAAGWLIAAGVCGCVVVLQPWLLAVAVGALFVVSAPSLAFVAAAVGLEEQTSSGGSSQQAAFLVRVGGDQFFYQEIAGLRVATLVALAIASVILYRFGVAANLARVIRETAVLMFMALWGVVLAVAQGNPLLTALTSVTPWLMVVCGMLAGFHLSHRTQMFVVAALIAKAAIGLFSYVQGDTLWSPDQFFELVFYDSALTSVAAAVLLGLLVSRQQLYGWQPWLAGVAASAVVLFAARRNVLVAAVIVGALLMVTAAHHRLLVRVMFALVMVVAAGVVLPDKTSGIAASVESAWATIIGESEERSTSEHLEDIRVAWDLAWESPWVGHGVMSEGVDGLAAASVGERLYVHNDFLQVWLRWGLPGVVGLVLLLGLVAVRALRAVRSGDLTLTVAGCWLLVLPTTLVFFPHLSTTWRWPMLFGVALALTLGRPSGELSRSQLSSRREVLQ